MSASCTGLGQFLSNAVVVGIGWYVVHVLSARRDRQKARRELVVNIADTLIAALNDLFIAARDYHTKPRDRNSENQIKMVIQDLAQSLSGLRSVLTDTSILHSCQASIRDLRASITKEHFEDEHVDELPEEDPLLQKIASAILRAKLSLSNLKFHQFK